MGLKSFNLTHFIFVCRLHWQRAIYIYKPSHHQIGFVRRPLLVECQLKALNGILSHTASLYLYTEPYAAAPHSHFAAQIQYSACHRCPAVTVPKLPLLVDFDYRHLCVRVVCVSLFCSCALYHSQTNLILHNPRLSIFQNLINLLLILCRCVACRAATTHVCLSTTLSTPLLLLHMMLLLLLPLLLAYAMLLLLLL